VVLRLERPESATPERLGDRSMSVEFATLRPAAAGYSDAATNSARNRC
jgi:hypothetical protein